VLKKKKTSSSPKSSHGPQNFYHSFPSIDTTKGMKVPSSTNNTPSVASSPPTSIQIDYSSKHDPKKPKPTKENIPNGSSNLTMKQKMVHGALEEY
jgi:hypothetical protein